MKEKMKVSKAQTIINDIVKRRKTGFWNGGMFYPVEYRREVNRFFVADNGRIFKVTRKTLNEMIINPEEYLK